MTSSLTLQVLPNEILEEIIDCRAQLEGDPEDWRNMGRPWSRSMLALLSTSRQIRLCAIRHIFHDVHIYCGDLERPMDKLRHLVIPDADLPLGSIAPQIKSVYIHTFAGVTANMSSQISADKFSELFHSSLLGAIRNKSHLYSLSLQGFMEYEMPCFWSAFPLDFQQAIISFFQLPSLKTFISRGITGMPSQIFKDAPLQKLWIANSVSKFGLFTPPAVDMLSMQNNHITSLVVHHSDIPNQLSLPNLHHLSVARLPSGFLNALWTIITSAWKNLIILEIDDNFNGLGDRHSYVIPDSINIGLLPTLEVFEYRHVQKLSNPPPPQPTVLPPITFFHVTGNISALKCVDISVYFEKGVYTKEEMLSRVYGDPSWDTLDRFLTTESFPDLAKVRITIEQTLIIFVTPERREESWRYRNAARALHVEVESALLPSFSRLLQKASVTLELQSIVHPSIY